MSTPQRPVVPIARLGLALLCTTWLPGIAAADCVAMSLPVLWQTTTPSPAGIQPDAWAVKGRTVHLFGKSAVLNVSVTCDITEIPSAFSWSAEFQGEGPVMPVPVMLNGSNTTTPSFVATGVGAYTVTLSGPAGTQALRIESVEGPGAWLPIGPSGLATLPGATTAVGRINDIVADALDPATYYAGTSQGGVFRSLNRGQSWWPISDHVGMTAMEVDALASSRDGTLYAAVGERGKDRVGFNESGAAIWQLPPAGTWTPVSPVGQTCPGAGTAAPLVAGPPGRTERILATWPPPGTSAIWLLIARLFHFVIPTDLVAATTTGAYWSSDGGKCWRQLLSRTESVTDIAFVPGSTDTLVVAAAQNGLMQISSFRTAPEIQSAFRPFPTGGLEIRLAPGKSAGRMYAIASRDTQAAATSSVALSTGDGGLHWQSVDSHSCTAQCDWFPALTVDPRDENRLYYGEVDLHVSTNGGLTFTKLPAPGSHVDYHAIFFPPDNPDSIIAANDGGLYQAPVSATPDRNIGAWSSINRYLQTNQCATFATPSGNRAAVLAGCWDNGYPLRSTGRYWSSLSGGDGEGTAFVHGGNIACFHLNAVSGSNVFCEQLGSPVPGRTIGAAPGFATNPYQDGQLWAIGLGGVGPHLYVTSLTGTSTDWHCADPGPLSSAGPHSLAFTPDGWIFAGRWDGSVRRFRADDISAGSATCTGGTSAATDVESVAEAQPGDAARGVGIATDLASSDHVALVVPGAKDPQRRVLEISRTVSTTGATWVPTARGGGIPSPAAALVTPTAASDTAKLDRLFAGSERGVLQGLRTASGAYSWTQPKGFPDAWVSELAATAPLQRFGQILRASTYGRGIWEFHDITNPAAIRSTSVPDLPNEHRNINFPLGCIACTVTFANQRAAENAGSWTAVSVMLPRQIKGAIRSVRVLDTAALPASRYFLARVVSMPAERDSAALEVVYAGVGRPPGTFVRSMRLQFVDESGRARSDPIEVRMNQAFHSRGFALVRLGAVLRGIGDVAIPTRITGSVNGQTLAPIEDGSLVAPIGSTVVFTTPATQAAGRHSGWRTENPRRQYSASNTFRLHIVGDTSVIAQYDAQRETD